jgi:CHAD domain-containing protein
VSNDSYIFEVPVNYSLEDLRPRMSSQHALENDPPQQITRQYLDTFDWRLYRAGQVLEAVREKAGQRLVLRSLHQGKPLLSQSARGIPRFATDCAGPGIRARLQQVIGTRALQSKVPVSSEVETLRLVNADGKTLLRLELHRDHISLPQSTRQVGLPSRLYLFPYRGYEKFARKVQRELTGRAGLRPCREDPMVYALKTVDIQAGGYSSRPSYPITREMPPHQALTEILRVLLDMMQANLDGACKDLDSEFLHDFREAALRCDFLLSQVPGTFADGRLRRFQEEFTWLQRISFPTRQLDVYLLLVEEFKPRLPERLQPYLNPFREYLRDHKQVEQRELRVALQSPRYAKLVRDWRQLLERTAAEEGSPIPEVSVTALANRLLWSHYQEVLEQGAAITPQSPPEGLCQLHHSCKRLGFLMEFFGALYPENKLTTSSGLLQALQQNLTEFEHIEMQQIQLKDFSRDMKNEQRLVPACVEALDLLIRDMAEQEQKLRKAFAKRFTEFADKKSRKRFQALFAGQPTAPQEDR